ncbi:MAG: hypothetical protein AB7I41_00315 [Candidatus Sericytochromatia bacterium]
MSPPLTFLIAHHRYLPEAYLTGQIRALNAQDNANFQVIYLHQGAEAGELKQALQQATFSHQVVAIPYPEIAGVCCWDLVRYLGGMFGHSVWGDYWSYLHQECWPAPDFVSGVLAGIATCEAEQGPEAVYRVNQLRCPLTPGEIKPDTWLEQLEQSGAVSWIERKPHRPDFVFKLAPWSEDAFVLPVALTRQYRLFSAVTVPLYFQDLFDLFLHLPDQPWFASVKWVQLGQPVIYHLNHPRAFAEYTLPFLQAVRQRPDLFGHLALFELAQTDFDYHEGFESDGERVISSHLHRFVQYMRYAERGTVAHWLRALQANFGPIQKQW